MKKTKLKRVSKSKTRKLQLDCDTLFQSVGKRKFPKSIVSGKPTEVIHHFHPKHTSNVLRYDWDNAIPLTRGEHFEHHNKSNPEIHAKVIKVKGWKWHDRLLSRKWNESVKTDILYYENVKNRLLLELTK